MLKRSRTSPLRKVFSSLPVLILLLSACSAWKGLQHAENGPAQHIVTGGTWIDDLYEDPSSLIPNASPETSAGIVDQTIYAPLFYGDESGVLHPGLATDLPTVVNGEVSADLTTWTFHLRPGLKWNDGQPEDARDVEFTWRLWTHPKFTPQQTTGINLITSTRLSADHLSITFHLKQGFESFVSVWADAAFAPLPAHHFSRIAPDEVLRSSERTREQAVETIAWRIVKRSSCGPVLPASC